MIWAEHMYTHRFSRLLRLTFRSFNLKNKIEQLVERCEKIRTVRENINKKEKENRWKVMLHELKGSVR